MMLAPAYSPTKACRSRNARPGRRTFRNSRLPSAAPAPSPVRKIVSSVPKVKADAFIITPSSRNQMISSDSAWNPASP